MCAKEERKVPSGGTYLISTCHVADVVMAIEGATVRVQLPLDRVSREAVNVMFVACSFFL
jgi:hypothetical protein